MRVHGDQGARVAQIVHQRCNLALQPFHHFQRDIEEVARATGGVQHFGFAQPRVEVADELLCVVRLAVFGQALHGGLHIAPILAQRFDDGGRDEPLHIGARRVMRAQLVALAFVQRAFEQRAEDRGFDLFPVGFGGFDEQVQLEVVERQRVRLLEQAAIELFQVLGQDGRKSACVHCIPQAFERRLSVFRVAAQFLELVGKAFTRDQVHIFREHREKAAHEEPGNGFTVMALTFKALAQFGQVGRDVACDLGGFQGRIEAVGVSPDRVQQVAGFLRAQVFKMDAKPVPVRKLVVALTLPRKVGVEFDQVAHIDHHQKRGPSVFLRYGTRVTVCLISRLEHGVVKPSATALAMADLPGRIRSQKQFQCALVLGGRRGELLGLKDEVTAFIEVDASVPLAPGMGQGHRTLKAIVEKIAVPVGHMWAIHAKQVRQLYCERLRCRHLAPTGTSPAFDELLYVQCHAQPFSRGLQCGVADPSSIRRWNSGRT